MPSLAGRISRGTLFLPLCRESWEPVAENKSYFSGYTLREIGKCPTVPPPIGDGTRDTLEKMGTPDGTPAGHHV